MKYTDPDGRCPFLVITGLVGAAIGAVSEAINSYDETGKVDIKRMLKRAAVGGLIGLGAGAAVSLVTTGLATGAAGATAFASSYEISAALTTIGGKVLSAITTLLGQKFLQQLNNANPERIKHIMNGSKGHMHNWEKLVPNMNWNDIESLIVETMVNGTESPYGSAFQRTLVIGGNEVVVTFQKLENGIEAISMHG